MITNQIIKSNKIIINIFILNGIENYIYIDKIMKYIKL